MNRFKAITETFDEHPKDKSFMVWINGENSENSPLTFGGFAKTAKTLASNLLDHMSQGDYLIISFEPSPEFYLSFVACIYAGIVAVPVYPPNPKDLNVEIPKVWTKRFTYF
jgi:phthiocerol/phenolphthiocerol synthesis type-I polyketide synthase C